MHLAFASPLPRAQAQLTELRAEQKAWGRDANRVSLLEQELDMMKEQMREHDDEKAGSRDEVEGLERTPPPSPPAPAPHPAPPPASPPPVPVALPVPTPPP